MAKNEMTSKYKQTIQNIDDLALKRIKKYCGKKQKKLRRRKRKNKAFF